jgi:hypothetical protein
MFYKKNRAKCLNCDDIVESKNLDDWIECSCGSLKIRGGSSFLERSCQPNKYKELSVIEFPEDVEFREDVTSEPPPPISSAFL